MTSFETGKLVAGKSLKERYRKETLIFRNHTEFDGKQVCGAGILT